MDGLGMTVKRRFGNRCIQEPVTALKVNIVIEELDDGDTSLSCSRHQCGLVITVLGWHIAAMSKRQPSRSSFAVLCGPE